eukprot:12650261-Prorocentrum_lima.AAC.1
MDKNKKSKQRQDTWECLWMRAGSGGDLPRSVLPREFTTCLLPKLLQSDGCGLSLQNLCSQSIT